MLTHKRFSLLLVAFCLITMAFTPVQHTWVRLGERTVNHAVDRDEIKVTIKEGVFKKIKLKVKHRKVTFRDVKVYYANGDVQDISLRREIPAGGETRVIDLDGNNRVITKVVFWYNTKRVRGKRAEVVLWGWR